MVDTPEKKSVTESLDVQRKTEAIKSGKRPVDEFYPYIPPDYNIPFLHIGTDKQLFLDNFILDHLEGVERVFPKPNRPDEPIIRTMELPWELKPGIFPAAAIQDPDDKKFKLWYVKDRTKALCYAEANDPLHWEKPLSEKCIPYKEHKATNIVLDNSGHHVALALNHDQSDPERKFLMIHNPGDRQWSQGDKKTKFLVSSDGLRWKTINENTPYQHHHYQRPIWDPMIQKWISYSQYSHHWNLLHHKRQIGRQESADYMNWSPKEVVLSVDWEPNLPPHLEFHDMSVRIVGGQYIGVVTEFMAEPIWCAGNANWHDHAYAHLALYSSRDGKHWRRVGDNGPWADNGRPGSYDYGFLNESVAGQLVHNGKTYIVYGARPEKQRPNIKMATEATFSQAEANRARLVDALGTYPRIDYCSIGVLILREDGWAELKPTYELGKVITRQFVFEGDTLKVNANAYGGYVKVEVLDSEFKEYKGFSAEDCDPVFSDDPEQIWHTVSWKRNTDVSALWNKPCRLCFHLHQASLYAFQFEEE